MSGCHGQQNDWLILHGCDNKYPGAVKTGRRMIAIRPAKALLAVQRQRLT
jgi:hypothetical protein